MIVENLKKIQAQIPKAVKLVAVSKTKPLSDISELYEAGHKIFGENKVQELTSKFDALPKDIEWHMIGHLQSNKVKFIAPFVSLIHSVDSLKLLEVISKEALKCDRVIDCLVQVHIAEEETKFGFDYSDLEALFSSDSYKHLKNIRICGVMGMATYTENEQQVRNEFKNLFKIFEKLKEQFFNKENGFKEISMGMSSDYLIAIEEGSTIVRIGNNIFGERYYPVVS